MSAFIEAFSHLSSLMYGTFISVLTEFYVIHLYRSHYVFGLYKPKLMRNKTKKCYWKKKRLLFQKTTGPKISYFRGTAWISRLTRLRMDPRSRLNSQCITAKAIFEHGLKHKIK